MGDYILIDNYLRYTQKAPSKNGSANIESIFLKYNRILRKRRMESVKTEMKGFVGKVDRPKTGVNFVRYQEMGGKSGW